MFALEMVMRLVLWRSSPLMACKRRVTCRLQRVMPRSLALSWSLRGREAPGGTWWWQLAMVCKLRALC